MRQARKPNWDRVIAGLRQGVAAGNVQAMTELAITINEGIRGRNGRVLVRRNAPYAFRLLRRAVESGDETAAGSLGYAYSVGRGTQRNVAEAIHWYRRAARSGDSTATSIWRRYIATPAKPRSHFNGGNEPPNWAMATPPSMLATAINTALAQERALRRRSACTDARLCPKRFPDTAAKRRCITPLFSS